MVEQPGLCGTCSETPKTGFLTTRLISGDICCLSRKTRRQKKKTDLVLYSASIKSYQYSNVFGVGVSCRILYSFVVYLYVSGSGSITSVGEERANLSAVVYL